MKSGILIAMSMAGVLLVGCGAGTGGTDSASPLVPEVVAPVVSSGGMSLSPTVQVGKVAPDFEIKDENGEAWKLSEYRGKVVLLDFWGFWCPYCVEELPDLRAMNDKYKSDGLVMLGINTDDDPIEELKKKLGESAINWRQGMQKDDDSMKRDYHVTGFPTKVLIGRDGTILYIGNFIKADEIEKAL